MRRLILCATLAGALHAQQAPPRAWRVSVVALAAATAADAASSWDRAERNPLLGARFGMRALSLKLVITGSGLAAQRQLLHRAPRRAGLASVVNFAAAALLSAVACYNARSRHR